MRLHENSIAYRQSELLHIHDAEQVSVNGSSYQQAKERSSAVGFLETHQIELEVRKHSHTEWGLRLGRVDSRRGVMCSLNL